MKIISTAEGTTFDFESSTARRCGSCSLCCKLLPTRALNKGSNTRCVYQRHNTKGCCSIYETRPAECRLWSCRWLVDPDTAGMPRPDRAHYALDPMPDMVRATNPQGESIEWQALQVWVDPAYHEAARAPELRRYMEHVAAVHGWPTIIRFSSREGYTVFPPPITDDHQWHEISSTVSEKFGMFSQLRAMGLEPPK